MFFYRGIYSNGLVFRGCPKGVLAEFYDDAAAMIADQSNQVRGGMYKADDTYYILAAATFTGAIDDYDALAVIV
ncbi:MAG: hypothetical protein WC476_08885 [Phycisphaerae bacterium]|jgi:hypothetical protein